MQPRALAAVMPDEPRWLETRAMLLSDHAEVFGDDAGRGFVVRVFHEAVSAVAVVGRPPADAIAAALQGATGLTPLLAQTADALHVERAIEAAGLRGWARERAIVHVLAEGLVARPVGPGEVGVQLLAPDTSLSHLPIGLRHELTHARRFAPVAGSSSKASRSRSVIRSGPPNPGGTCRSIRSSRFGAGVWPRMPSAR